MMAILQNPSTVMRSFLPSRVTLKCRTKTRLVKIKSFTSRTRLTTTNSCSSHTIKACTLRFRRRLTKSTMTRRLRRLKGLKLKNKKMIIKSKNPTIKIKSMCRIIKFRSVAASRPNSDRKSSRNQDDNRGSSPNNLASEELAHHTDLHRVFISVLKSHRSMKRLSSTTHQRRRCLIKMSKKLSTTKWTPKSQKTYIISTSPTKKCTSALYLIR